MKKTHKLYSFSTLCLLLLTATITAQTPGEWTWMSGDNTPNTLGVFGVQGVPDPANTPPPLYEPCEWKDNNGNFWLFGGSRSTNVWERENALWKYDVATNQWTWMKGSQFSSGAAVYGTKGISNPANTPGARMLGVASWTDLAGNLWLFGGQDANVGWGSLNDLWKYNIATNDWTWMGGSSTFVNVPDAVGVMGVPSASTWPGGKSETSGFGTDAAGNLWLFSGQSSFPGSRDNLWKYDVSTNLWTWIKGGNIANVPAVYGIKGVPAITNTPGDMYTYASWEDGDNLWFFGGRKPNNGATNALWKYTISTNQWTWVKGPNIMNDLIGNYGVKCVSALTNNPPARTENRARVKDACGNFWNFGGSESTGLTYNDLWYYNLTKNEWTWMSGSQLKNQSAVYGTKGISSPATQPGGAHGGVSWIDDNGYIYIFGGFNVTSSEKIYNTLFRYVPPFEYNKAQNNATSCSPCNGSATINFSCAVPNYSYVWSNGSSTLNSTNNSNTITGLCPGIYTVTATASCSQTTIETFTITGPVCATCLNPPVLTLINQTNETCSQANGTVTVAVNGGTGTAPFTYAWSNGQSGSTANNLAAGTYTVIVTDNVADCADTLDITITNTGAAVSTIENNTVCSGNNYTYPDGTVSNNITINENHVSNLTTTLGCDSIITTNLNVLAIAVGTDVMTSCIPINWINGNNYSTSNNTATHNLPNGAANGCDSLVTLNLTINNSVTFTQNPSLCTGQSITVGTNTYGSTGNYTDILIAASGCDSTVTTNLTITPAVTFTQNPILCAGGSITVAGNTYTTTGNYLDTLTASAGCDSIITTNLTIGTPINITQNPNICAGESVIVGLNTYTVTGNYTDVLTASAGCDSIVTTNLTVGTPINIALTPTLCAGGSITVAGNTYTTTGNYLDTLTASGGCDSIIATNLTVNPTITFTQNPNLCIGQSITVGASTYSTTGIYTDVLIAANGCDSTVTTNLSIIPLATGIDIITSCIPITWIDGINYTASNNTATFNLVNGAASGCDSLVSLDLTINSFVTGTDVITSCTPITWIDGINYATSNNTATFNIVAGAASGCDSLVSLDLTINNAATGTAVITSCNPINWIDGNNYSTSNNTATHNIPSGAANGCDSVVTLNLTIITPSTTTQTFIECEGFSIAVGTNTYNTSGIYTDTISNCNIVITNLTINPAPQLALFSVDDNCQGNIGSVAAIASSSNPSISYNWNTGATDSIINNLSKGVYTVTISDAAGCTNTETVSVLDLEIDCDYFVYVPNFFSPNGDGNNDIFFIEGRGIATLSVKIYNRWGNRVFEINDLNQGWNGRYKGSEQNTAVFVYILKATFLNGETVTKSGDISLIR